MRNPLSTIRNVTPRRPVRLGLAGTVAVCLALASTLSTQESLPESPCLDGLPLTEALPLETPLPALYIASDGCESFETPAVSFMVGQEGLTYYVAIEPSTGCAEADDRLRQWISCWIYEPALCGGEAMPSMVRKVVEWTGNESAGEPPCERASYEPPGEGEG